MLKPMKVNVLRRTITRAKRGEQRSAVATSDEVIPVALPLVPKLGGCWVGDGLYTLAFDGNAAGLTVDAGIPFHGVTVRRSAGC